LWPNPASNPRFFVIERLEATLQKLQRHDISGWALTGGIATELHLQAAGREISARPLNDVDFITGSFDSIPASLGSDYLFRHVHPLDAPGKTLLQFVDPETALRIDVFRAFGDTMRRTSAVKLAGGTLRLIAIQDLLARNARLALDLAGGVPIPSKYAADFLRLAETNPGGMETAWQDQRRPNHPATFEEAKRLLRALIPQSPHLLITPEYSKGTSQVCGRCANHSAFALANPSEVLGLLDYC
jgi:hypothetical protein